MELFDIGVWKYLRLWHVQMFCWVFKNSLTHLVFSLMLTIPWISLESSFLDSLLFVDAESFSSSWYIKVWCWIHWWDINARSWNYRGLCPFLNHREKMELVCHPPLLSSEFLLLVPCLPDVNCMFHPRSSSGGDSNSYNY